MLKRQITYAFKTKANKIRKKDLKAIYRFVTALTDSERDNRIREIDSNFGFLQPKQQDYLRSVYMKHYTKGEGDVQKDIFTNSSKATFTEVVDRFDDYQKIESPDWDFIEKLAKSQSEAMEELLGASDQQGYGEKFSYHIYEKYYIDGSRELEEQNAETPEGLDEDSIYFLADMAYADGVENVVEELAISAVQKMAEDLLEERA